MRKTSFLLLSLLAALAPGTLPAQRHPMPPNLKLASGIDMRGGPLLRASRVETDAIKVNGTLVTNMSEVVAGAAAGATALQPAAAGVFFSQLRLYTDGTNLFFVTGASVTNTVAVTPVPVGE